MRDPQSVHRLSDGADRHRETHGQFVAELLVAQARMESANTSTRSKRQARQQRLLGLPPSHGRRCFGYTKRYEAVVPEEVALVREAIDRLFAGESLRGICFDWEERGVKTADGNAWRAHLLSRYLSSPTISAQRENEGTLIPGKWPGVVTPEEGLRLRTFLHRRATHAKIGTARKYLLAGLLRCGKCEGRMVAQPRKDDARRYVCRKSPGYPNCGSMSVLAEPLERIVFEMIVVAMDDAALSEALRAKPEPSADDAVLLVQQDEAALKELSDDYYVRRLLDREEFFATRATLQKRLDDNRARLATSGGPGVVGNFLGGGGRLRDAWQTASLEWRRAVVSAVIDHVVINATAAKGRVPFDVERVRPVWRY